MAKFNPEKHHRGSNRCKGYDYSNYGGYFLTICAHNRKCTFGRIVDGEMRLNKSGYAVKSAWGDLPRHYSGLKLDSFALMPNHVHGIVVFMQPERAGLKPAPTRGRVTYDLSEVVRAFKTFSSRKINLIRGTKGKPVWQRNFFDRVIRNEKELNKIRQYILDNPGNWETDRENPSG